MKPQVYKARGSRFFERPLPPVQEDTAENGNIEACSRNPKTYPNY